MTKRKLTEKHKDKISKALLAHHRRNRRSKSFLGRLINRVTGKNRKAQRAKRVDPYKEKINGIRVKIRDLHKKQKALKAEARTAETKNHRLSIITQATRNEKEITALREHLQAVQREHEAWLKDKHGA